jgi:hypothetical protein
MNKLKYLGDNYFQDEQNNFYVMILNDFPFPPRFKKIQIPKK